jgi:hypothetical protein
MKSVPLNIVKQNRWLMLAGLPGLIIICLFIGGTGSPIASAQLNNSPDLAAPDNLTAIEDDNNAILSWGDPIQPDRPNPSGVSGYRISYGLVGSNNPPAVQLTSERTIQIQPLTNGKAYYASVQAVDDLGNLSAPSQTVTFTGNPARVNSLRERMTGFFDDFDRAAGPLDELKWNQAFSACDDPMMTASFINAQFHAHNMTLSTCDRAQVINRPRATFDFTGRTGTVAFDLDGAVSRSFWYLDFIDAAAGPTDITSHIDPSDAGKGHPGNILRIKQSNNNLEIALVNAAGKESTIAVTNSKPYPPLDWAGFKTIPNLRRHWEIHLSQQKVEITIDGKIVLAEDLALPFSKATLHWNLFSYNTAKQNVPYTLIHWDNFGFDGPAPTIETHNYRAAGYAGQDFLKALDDAPVSLEIKIPDPVAGATSQRLMFTLQMSGFSKYEWASTDKVLINGTAFPIPRPNPVAGEIDNNSPYAMILPLPAGVLKTGSNQITFVTKQSNILNIHTELDFPKSGPVPDFTQPMDIYPELMSHAMPAMPDVGPAVYIEKVGDDSATDGSRYSKKTLKVRGIVPVSFDISNGLAMSAMGKNPGIDKVQLRINKSVVKEWNFANPVPATSLTYDLDTTRYTNGKYEMDVVAFNSGGAISIPNYFEAHAKQGDYYPVYLNISNSKSGQISLPLPETVPTPTVPPASPTVAPVVNLSTVPRTQPAIVTPKESTLTDNPVNYSLLIQIFLGGFCYLLAGEVLRLRRGIKSPSKKTYLFTLITWPISYWRK